MFGETFFLVDFISILIHFCMSFANLFCILESWIENHVTGTTTTLDLIKKLLLLHTPNNKQNSDKTQETDIGDSSSSSTEEQNGT